MSAFLPGRSYAVIGTVGLESDLAAILPVDRIAVDGAEVGIKELRASLSLAAQRPYGPTRLLLITNAENLTEACQNTLLKTLEEPSPFLLVILQAQSLERFLPTVRSRLHVRQYQGERKKAEPVFVGNEAQAAQVLQAVKERTGLVAVLKEELRFQLSSLGQSSAHRLSLLERAINRLERNCNQKLVIDQLLLHWFSQTGNG